jgi:tetratricopeptide (TPR) repeat protein
MGIHPIYLKSFEDSPESLSFFLKGYECQIKGNLSLSIHYYRKSIRKKQTAEAYSFLAWTFSLLNKPKNAIRLCKKAIQVDPSLGNPYNDIGVYLMDLRKYSLSIPYFQKAKTAERYECRFYPYFNLGRVYEILGRVELARMEYKTAIEIEPRYEFAKQSLNRLKRIYN